MANTIITKNSSTASAIPTAGVLTQGELAVNVADKRLFTKNSAGAVVELGTTPSTIDINAGTIDGTPIGANAASSGAFTSLAASTFSLSGDQVQVSEGGTGASTAAAARTNLGVAIGTDVQAYNSTLASVAAGTYTGDDSITTVGTITTGVWNGTDVAVADGGTGASTAAGARTNLGVAIGVDVQAYDADLTTLGGLTKTDGNFIVGDGTTWVVESGATARTSLGLGSLATSSTVSNDNWSGTDLAVANGGTGASTAADARTNLGVVIGTDVQAYNSTLASVAAGTYTGDDSITTVGTITTGVWNGTDIAVADGGTGASTANAGFNNLAPTQTGNSGKFLTTNGTDTSWATVDALPSQTGNSGKYLTTNGTDASWAVVNVNPALDDLSDVTITAPATGEGIVYNGTGWVNGSVGGNTTTKGLYEMANTISANYTIGNGNNAVSAGPITVNSGVSVTVPTGSRWVVV